MVPVTPTDGGPGRVRPKVLVTGVPGVPPTQVLPVPHVPEAGDIRGAVTGPKVKPKTVTVRLVVPLVRRQQLAPSAQLACLASRLWEETAPAMSTVEIMLNNLSCI